MSAFMDRNFSSEDKLSSWLTVDVAASRSMTFADQDQGGTIQIQVTAGTVETMRFDDIENVQWHS